MAGHSKWANIKHRKGRQDAARGNLFAKLCRAVEAAARQGGGDPTANAVLAGAIDKARSSSVPKDNIERAIKRGTGELVAERLDTIYYEGYAPGGVALLVQVVTDNRNRAASDVRSAFTRNGGSLGEPGSVGYLFDQKGYLLVEGDEDDIFLAVLESGAEDIRPTPAKPPVSCAWSTPWTISTTCRRSTETSTYPTGPSSHSLAASCTSERRNRRSI